MNINKINTSPLQIVGNINIPDSLQSHRFYKEAELIIKLLQKKLESKKSKEPIIGTKNSGEVELYGWAPNVPAHVDNSGFIYFVALNDGESFVISKPDKKEVIVDLKKGTVVRMNDHMPHLTFDDNYRVCAFIGSFKEPDDAYAIKKLKCGIKSLAKGDYYGAPRVRDGFRAILPDECYVMDDNLDYPQLMLLDDAKKKKKFIQTCGLCDKVAVKIDNHFPWYTDKNRCRTHLKQEKF